MYINPAAVVAFLSGFVSQQSSDSSTVDVVPAGLSGAAVDVPAAVEGLEGSHRHARGRAPRHRHDRLAKRAITIWHTQTVQYTVPAAKSQTTQAAAFPTTLATQVAAPVTTTSPTAAATQPAVTGSANGPKKVFAHFMMGNAYPMGVSDFAQEINKALSVGIDGFALNVGPDSWMKDRTAKMYQAAAGTAFKLFISLDMAVMAGDGIDSLTSWVTDYTSHPAQYFYQNKQFVSTFAGESITFGQSNAAAGWSSFKSTLAARGVDIFFVPSFTALGPSAAIGMSSNDGAFSWDAWPTSNSAMSTAEDAAYMSGRNGKVYMAGVSPWFYTHFSYKNWIYKSDDLYTTRWEQIVSMQPDFVEIITWNDYGESSYIGDLNGATPYDGNINSAAWTTGFDHTAWADLSSYYIQAYKNGAYPSISANKLYWWYRPHPKGATASSDPYGKPTNYDWADDDIFVTVMLTGAATVTVTSGGSPQTFSGAPGVNHFRYKGFSAGTPSVQIAMNGAKVLDVQGPVAITNSPTIYNFNPVVAMSAF